MRVMSSRSFSSRAAAMERTWASQRGMNTFWDCRRVLPGRPKWDMRGKKPGFMLHLRMRGNWQGRPRRVVRTLFFEDTYRATGLCAAIGARLALEGMTPGLFRAAQLPDPVSFMRHFLALGYEIQALGSKLWAISNYEIGRASCRERV